MSHIDELAQLGTSTWLDDLSRERLESGNLAEIIKTKSIVGVTTNPAIFAAAMSKGTAYDSAITALKEEGAKADDAVYSLAIDDVANACDLFAGIYKASEGRDGRVSIEVDPRISADTQATIQQARELWARVNRPNLMIKIPATEGSLPAIADALADGISVNVTLIFSVERRAFRLIRPVDGGIRRTLRFTFLATFVCEAVVAIVVGMSLLGIIHGAEISQPTGLIVCVVCIVLACLFITFTRCTQRLNVSRSGRND